MTWRRALWHGPSIVEVFFALLFASKHSPFIIAKTRSQGMLTEHNMKYSNAKLEQQSYHKAYPFLLLEHLRCNANLHSKTPTNILRPVSKARCTCDCHNEHKNASQNHPENDIDEPASMSVSLRGRDLTGPSSRHSLTSSSATSYGEG